MSSAPKRFRVRKLHIAGPGVVDYHRDMWGRRDQVATDEAGAVYPISATELELPHDEVITRLRLGLLSPQDLVEEDTGWSALIDSPDFGDAALSAARQAKRKAAMAYLVVLVIAPLGAVGLVALLLALFH